MPSKYSDIIALRGQKAAYNIANESNEDWKSFIANDHFNEILGKVISSVRNNDTDMHKSFWISGTYGTGKSHAGAVIKHLLCDPVEEIRDYLEDEYSSSKYDFLRNELLKLRDQKRLFPVMLYGSSSITHKEDLSLVIQRSILEALTKAGIEISVKTDFDSYIEHINNDEKFWDTLIYDDINLRSVAPTRDRLVALLKIGDTSTLSKVKKALRHKRLHLYLGNENLSNWFFEVQNELASKTEFDGLLVLWDEFTDVMNSPIGATLLVALQEIDEKIMNTENNSYFFYISHPSALNSLKVEDREKTKGRYHYMTYNMEPVSAFKIMSSKFKIVGDEYLYRLLTDKFFDAHNELLSVFSSTSTNVEETKNDLRKLFPLHPSTANLATYYAREAGSSSRSVFQFIGENDAVRSFLESEEQFRNGNTITADYLWDYVESEFNSNVAKFGAVTERYNSRRLQVTDKGSSYLAVFKSVLLLNALNNIANSSSVTPSEENIKNLFVGTSVEPEMEEILKYFDENSIIQRLPGGLFSIQFSALPPKEIEDIKQRLCLTEFKFTSSIVNFGNAARDEIDRSLKQVNRLKQYMFFSQDTNEHTLLNKVENAYKATNPYEIFLAMFFARNLAELNELKVIASNASKEERFRYVTFIVFESTFGDDKYERFIEYQANATCAQKHNLPDQQKVHNESSRKMIESWMVELKSRTFTFYLNGTTDVQSATRLVSTINNTISSAIFDKGPESLPLIKIRQTNTYWEKKSSKELVGKILLHKNKTDIVSKLPTPATHVTLLLQDSVDENLEWKPDCDPNHPLLLVSKFIDNKFKNTRKNESFNLADRLQELSCPPFGLYQSYAGMAMVAFAMRKWVNQIYSNNGKPRSEQHLKEDIVEMFKVWESGKQSAKLEFRFETKESRKLCESFIKLFKLDNLRGYSDISSLTDARWAITHEFSSLVGYPLWSLKYLSNISDSITLSDEFKELIDNILVICGDTDLRNPSLIASTLKGIETYRFELGNLINNADNQFRLGFINYLITVPDVEFSEDQFDSAFDFIKKNMESTIGLWSEEEVHKTLMRWKLTQLKPTNEPPRISPFGSPVKPNPLVGETPSSSPTPYNRGDGGIGVSEPKSWPTPKENDRLELISKINSICDKDEALLILVKVVEHADAQILELINNEL